MTALGWRLEWLQTRARTRLLVLNVLIPLLLVVPVATAGAPPHHAAAVYAVLFVLFGTFGAAIPLLRDGERGFIRRLALTRARPAGVLLGRTLAGACIDGLQLAPAVLLVAWGAGMGDMLVLFLALLGTLVFANVFGAWIAALARSVAEGALFCAVASLLLLHASGVFRTPSAESMGGRVEQFAPYRALHEQLLAVSGGLRAEGFVALLAADALLLLATAVLASRLVRALARADARE